MKVPKIKPECLKCGFFNPQCSEKYRCRVTGYCPDTYGDKEYKEGRLARALHPEADPGDYEKYLPYNGDNDTDGNVSGLKSSLWINGWFED